MSGARGRPACWTLHPSTCVRARACVRGVCREYSYFYNIYTRFLGQYSEDINLVPQTANQGLRASSASVDQQAAATAGSSQVTCPPLAGHTGGARCPCVLDRPACWAPVRWALVAWARLAQALGPQTSTLRGGSCSMPCHISRR
jgi:hypothetical protein